MKRALLTLLLLASAALASAQIQNPTVPPSFACTNQFVSALNGFSAPTCSTPTLVSAQFANQGTTTTVLHGNAAGNPSWAAVVSGDLNITSTSCTNQVVTAISSSAAGTCSTVTSAMTSGTFSASAHNLLSSTHGDTTGASPTRGDVITAQGASPTWSRLAKGTQYQTLNGGANEPLWDAVHLDQVTAITGTLGLGNGGLGIASGTNGGIPYFTASTSALTSSGALAANTYVKGGGAGGAPTTGLTTDDGTVVTVNTAHAFRSSTANDNSSNFFRFTGTMPTSPTATVYGWNFQVTGAGSASQQNNAVNLDYLAGYTGSSLNSALRVVNANNGTGTIGAPGTPTGNIGVLSAAGVTSGASSVIGVVGQVNATQSSTKGIGLLGEAAGLQSSYLVGVMGRIHNSATGNDLGGYFSVGETAAPSGLASAALMANNGAKAAPIIVAQDSSTTVWQIADNGSVQGNQTTKNLTESSATTFVTVTMSSGSRIAGTISYSIEANDASDFQARAGIIPFVAVDKAGAITCTVGTPDAASEVVAVSTGTLTNTFTCADGTGNVLNLLANAVSSLTQTTLLIRYRVELVGTMAVTPQ